MPSDRAHDPIYIPGPIIPTIAPRNSPFLLFGKKRGFQYYYNYPTLTIHHLCLCRCLFNCPKHAPDVSAFETRLHVPHVLWYDGDLMTRDFIGTWAGILLLAFPFDTYTA